MGTRMEGWCGSRRDEGSILDIRASSCAQQIGGDERNYRDVYRIASTDKGAVRPPLEETTPIWITWAIKSNWLSRWATNSLSSVENEDEEKG